VSGLGASVSQMTTPNQLDVADLRSALELHRAGASLAEVATACECNVRSFRTWLGRGAAGRGSELAQEFARDWHSAGEHRRRLSVQEWERLIEAEGHEERPSERRQRARLLSRQWAAERVAAQEAAAAPMTPLQALMAELKRPRSPSEGAARQAEWENEQRAKAN